MTYGISVNPVDDHLAMSKSQISKCIKHLEVAMVEMFGPEFLIAPSNAQDMYRLLVQNVACGFQGMLGSINCMH
jgi:hypothetical protein